MAMLHEKNQWAVVPEWVSQIALQRGGLAVQRMEQDPLRTAACPFCDKPAPYGDELMLNPRFAAQAEFERVSPELVKRASGHAAAILGDIAGRRGAMHGRIKALNPKMRVCGPALTVEVRPGDNLSFHIALAIAKPGDVIVVDGKGDLSYALVGELMTTQAAAAGIAGMVVDGAVRDSELLAATAFPVWAAGSNPCGPTKNIPGRLAIPISAGNASVNPGDLVIGDADGVVVIPRLDVETVLAGVEAKLEMEAQRLREIARGELVSPWLEDAIRAAGMLGPNERFR
jgi:regulator of RNase E activity RraA